MDLKKRIFRLSSFVLLLSLLVMGVVTAVVVNNVFFFEGGHTSSNTIFQLQKQLNQLKEVDTSTLQQNISDTGGQLYIVKDGDLIFSSGGEEAEDIQEWPIDNQAEAWEEDEDLIISRRLDADGVNYKVYILFEDWDESGEVAQLQTVLVRSLLLIAVAVLLIIVLNSWLSRKLIASILKPLDQLQKGVERIEQGDYATDIAYKGDREFETVISGFNQMQASLESSRLQNQLYEQNRTQMIAAISHDLRTPLTSIKGYSKGLLDGIAQTPEKREQYLEIIYQKSQIMETLLEKLFAFSQLETDHIPFHMETVNLPLVLQAYAAEKAKEWQGEARSLTVECDQDCLVKLDQVQFRRLLDNLVDNAVKYAGVSPLWLRVGCTVQAQNVTIFFRDNGKGVPKEELSKIFEDFYRVDPARQEDGHGLGLSIVSHIVKRLGGTVSVENRDGLYFRITLPKEG